MSVKGLHKIIYPFAPDQSGAVSVLYELGGMIIICDAGGCAGNICGFDEPRWLRSKSAVFSAGLRDMDAILGRDELLIEKITKASQKLDARFIAIVGTPVPATIATDYRALRRMAEKKTGLPVITVDTNGALWYDSGIEKAYAALFDRFTEGIGVSSGRSGRINADRADIAEGSGEASEGAGDQIRNSAGVIGVTPLDTGLIDAGSRIASILKKEGFETVICYGAEGNRISDSGEKSKASPGDGQRSSFGGIPEDFALAGRMERNIVISPAGLRAARMLKERFGTPYECCDPLIDSDWELPAGITEAERVLVIHQQIRANTIRRKIREAAAAAADSETLNAIIERTDAGSETRNPAIARIDSPADTGRKDGRRCPDVTVATWFMLDDEISEAGDFRMKEESEFTELAAGGGYDVIIADPSFRKAAKGFKGIYIDLPHFAVSGKLI